MRKLGFLSLLAAACLAGAGLLWSQGKAIPAEPKMCGRYRMSVQTPVELGKELECRINWLHEARAFTLAGGKNTLFTNSEEFEHNRKRAQNILASLGPWLKEVGINSASTSYENEHGGQPLLKPATEKVKKAVKPLNMGAPDDGMP